MEEKILEFTLHHKGPKERKWMLRTFHTILGHVERSLGIKIEFSITFIDDTKGTEVIYGKLPNKEGYKDKWEI
ncbi:hypothetical protein [uncultured Anaerococcus sp.]|uniref:hypothetical protein n=1 Tax=uncultured Anaerococcus sp. TaxID=293428 RepID=UPI00288B80E6|nr:hypothetical protein [uncultured Anaerococcus sp.]